MKNTLTKNLIKEALAIIRSNHLTPSEINCLLRIDPGPVPRSLHLETVRLELAGLILANGLTIQEGADLFRKLAKML